MTLKFKVDFILLLFVISCTSKNENKESNFANNIRFNHLYVVIDDSTYNHLFECIQILSDFSYTKEQTVNTGESAWSGKYLFGRHQYLEIFKPEGDKKGKFGELGLGFITDKSGTLNSVRNTWKRKKERTSYSDREIVREGRSYPLFQLASIEQSDSVRIFSWLMEYQKEEMKSVGFTDQDHKEVISWKEYSVRRRAADLKVIPDSIKFEKAFDRVTQLYLTLTQDELDSLKKSLLYFGFTEKGNSLISQDITINYKISHHKVFVLNQIHFKITGSLKEGIYRYENLEFRINEHDASLKFLYNCD
ncbi:MAG: hypothetical protein KKG99_05075 [Bacteroidetes bacterium]|nr:hypothetical protein [Bacteroidota bacterium]